MIGQRTGRRQAERKAGRRSIPLVILKVLYWLLFAVSAVVVILYWHFSRPPQVERELPSPPPAASQAPALPSADPGQTEAPQVHQTGAGERTFKDRCYTFLVMGLDAGNGNTDTMMVLTYDVPGRHIGVVSVPRDTLMDVPRTVKKINAAYSAGGIEEVRGELSDLLGFPLDYYVIIDLRGLRTLVDTLGGVDFDVPVNMNYDDPNQNLHIHLKKGMQHLDGAQALQLARFRSGYANADIGRIDTQQKLLKALAGKLLSWDSVGKVNDFVTIFAENVETDLTLRELGYFALSAMELDLDADLAMGTLPGDGMVTYKGIPYYYQLYPQETLDLLNDLGMSPYTAPLSREDLNIFQVQ